MNEATMSCVDPPISDTRPQSDQNNMFSILYVDDEQDLLTITRHFLERTGRFKVSTMTSAQEALKSSGLLLYDAIISDYQMPGMDGITFLKNIRQRCADIPFILFTGRGREEVVIEAINNGADFYLQKGGNPESQFAELEHKILQSVKRKQTERSLLNSEKHLSDIIDFLPDATFAIDRLGQVIAWNHAIEEMTGVPSSDMLGKGNFEYAVPFYGSRRPVLIDLINEAEEKIDQFYTKGYRTGDSLSAETDLPTPKGNRISALAKACRLYNKAGDVIGAIESIRDISPLKETEQELRESEEKFRTLVEQSLDGTFISDVSGLLLFANERTGEIIRHPHIQDLVGSCNILEFVLPELQESAKQYLLDIHEGGVGYLEKFQLLTIEKTVIWIECIGRKISYEGAPAILFSIHDITDRILAEEELRESEQNMATIFRSSPVALTVVSAEDKIFVDVNEAFIRNFGYAKDEIIGKNPGEIGFFPNYVEYQQIISSLQNQREIHGMEISCRMKTGEIRTCLFSSNVIMMGNRSHILSTIEDITEHKKTKSSFQALVRSMVGTTGANSLQKITETVCSWLKADCVMIGEIQPDKMAVNVLSMIFDGENISDFSYTLKGTPCEYVVEKGFCFYADNIVEHFPGSTILEDFKIRGYIGTPLLNSEGQVFGTICVLFRRNVETTDSIREIMDIIAVKAAADIERSHIEQRLVKNQQILTKAMDLAKLANWEYDVSTGMFTFDDRFYALYGTTAEREGGNQMLAETYAKTFIHPSEGNVVAEENEKAIHTSDPKYEFQREHRIIRRDGEVRDIVVRYGITKDIEGRTVTTYGANQDITDHKRIEEALRLANRQLSLLSSITRHDILNKITVIIGYLYAIEEELTEPHLLEYLSSMKSAVHVIQSHIEFTRVYQDLGSHEPQWLMLDMVLPRSSLPDSITLKADFNQVSIFADLMLEKVFLNLLDNSIRHGARVSEIRVFIYETDTDLTIVWEDNGVGIPVEDKEMIFERGFGKNTGLGMFLAREALSLTGISIRETGLPGKGARFEIIVPKGVYRSN